MTANIVLFTYHSPIGDLLLGATTTHLILCDWLDNNGHPRSSVIKRLYRFIREERKERECGERQAEHKVRKKINGREERIEWQEQSKGEWILPILQQAVHQLNEYFQGTRRDFTLPIQTYGTPFQQQVWQQLQTIPYGTTMTYKQQAVVLDCPNAIRAVANANRLNALSIIIPCHRVLGSNHTLTGYAGGLEAKRWLLNHESH